MLPEAGAAGKPSSPQPRGTRSPAGRVASAWMTVTAQAGKPEVRGLHLKAPEEGGRVQAGSSPDRDPARGWKCSTECAAWGWGAAAGATKATRA